MLVVDISLHPLNICYFYLVKKRNKVVFKKNLFTFYYQYEYCDACK